MKEKFPEVKMVFYVAKELITYVHMELESPLFSYSRNNQIIDEIQSFMSDKLDERFKVMFPQLVSM